MPTSGTHLVLDGLHRGVLCSGCAWSAARRARVGGGVGVAFLFGRILIAIRFVVRSCFGKWVPRVCGCPI
eukprot:7376604-Prymnesium_polylepis.1